jgi:putative membrane protein
MSKKNKPTSINDTECPIKKHSAKSWIAAMILGVFIGLAVIVPGVSGSTIAIIFGLYTAMLYALGNIFNDFKRCIKFLIPIGIGAVVGFGAGFLVIQSVFEKYVFQVICLFVGLMIGAIPALTREINGEKKNTHRVVLFILGVAIPLAIGAVSILLSGGAETTSSFTDFPIWRIFVYLPLGFVVSVTQIVPGLSATAILMAFGQFKPILNSLHRDYIFENPQVLFLYAALGLGFAAGIVCVSRIFSAILKNHKITAFFMVIGLSFGSIASMFLNTDIYGVYVSWAQNGISIPTLIVSAVLLAIGFVGSFLLTRYELSHAEK